jgi:hypothetical protein
VSFTIGWTVDDGEWDVLQKRALEHAAGSDYDRGLEALEELLLGTIRFLRGGPYMTPEPIPRSAADAPSLRAPWNARSERTALSVGFDVSLVDFGWQLAYILGEPGPGSADGTESLFNEAGLTIGFKKSGDTIVVRSNKPEDRGWMLTVATEEFRLGAHRYLASLCDEIHRRAPQLFAWQTFQPLVPYLDGEGGSHP